MISFLTQQPTCGRKHSWQGGWLFSTTMTTATTTTKTITTTMVNEDNDKDPNSEDNDNLIFDTTTNLWLDAFLVRRGGEYGDDDDCNSDDKQGK